MVEVPAWASVVVIGGGVMGCSTLYHLARNGVSDAILLERNQLTSGTTWHSAAQVRALRSTRNLTDLIRYSIGLYSALEDETGQQTGWINRGSLSIATHRDRMIHIERQKALAHLFGVRAETVDRNEAEGALAAHERRRRGLGLSGRRTTGGSVLRTSARRWPREPGCGVPGSSKTPRSQDS